MPRGGLVSADGGAYDGRSLLLQSHSGPVAASLRIVTSPPPASAPPAFLEPTWDPRATASWPRARAPASAPQSGLSAGELTRAGSSAVLSVGSFLQRATSQVLGQVSAVGGPRTFRCSICYENVHEDERVVLEACGNADHGCCQECMQHYITGLVADGRVNAICCPQGKECGAQASADEIQDLIDDDAYDRYMRFLSMQRDRTLRQCPACSLLCKPEVDEDGEVVAEMRCRACGQELCYYHSSAHIGRPCEEYRREMAKEERLTMEGALKGTRPCPSCGIPTDKVSGCNHMTCGTCQDDWCWICGNTLDNIAWHYNPGNVGGCAQFQDSNTGGRLMQCLRVLMWPVMVFSLALFAACTLTGLVWIVICAVIVGPFVRCDGGKISTCAAVFTYLPFLVFQVAWLAVAAVLQLLLLPCGATSGTLFFLMQVPFASVMAVMEGR